MSHISTLKIFDEYKRSGLSDEQARIQTDILENSFITKLNEFRNEFASNKIVTTVGTLILIALTAIGGELWSLSVDFKVITKDVSKIESRLEDVDNRLQKVVNRLDQVEQVINKGK